MANNTTQTLRIAKSFKGQAQGDALVHWLNSTHLGLTFIGKPKFVETLLLHAQMVCRITQKYKSVQKLRIALKQKKLPPAFWDCHQRLNAMLAKFTYAPQIDLHELPDGERVSWVLSAQETPMPLISVQVRSILRLIEDGTLLKIRKCQQCGRWYFAHYWHQQYCTTSCRRKHLSGTEEFKEKRRKYMRNYYKVQKSTNVK
jgi:hypothetical protein